MPPVSTPAIVLATFRYGETSKIARLATRDLGVQSGIAKGALRPKSPFGAALHLLSEGNATLHLSRSSDLHTLAQFDPVAVRIGLAQRLDRFALACLLAELMLRCAPAGPHRPSYELLRDALAVLEATPAGAVEVVGLRCLWRLVSVLGFAPSLQACARDGAAIPGDRAAIFSLHDGGFLCPRCGAGVSGSRMEPSDRAGLTALLEPEAELPALDDPHLAAHRRLFDRWVRQHLGEGATLPALAFWLDRRWAAA
ncbi:MAG: DNA repair protein RecO [Gemmatimonadales bacterium]